MGHVALSLKVMPESPEVDTGRLEKEIRERLEEFDVEIKDIKQKPLAFGLKCIEVLLVFPDARGGTDEIESALSGLEGVASVEAGDITLL